MPTSNYPGPHNMGMMGGGGGYNSGGMSTHYNQPPMMRDRPVPHGPMMRPMISGPMRTSMMGYRQGELDLLFVCNELYITLPDIFYVDLSLFINKLSGSRFLITSCLAVN